MIIRPPLIPKFPGWILLLSLLPDAKKLKEYAELAKDGLDVAREKARALGKEHRRKMEKA